MLGADFLSTDVTESGATHTLHLHFLSPNNPLWDTKVAFISSLFEGQLHNNFTIVNGPENNQWELKAFHSTAWKFIYSQIPSEGEARDLWSRLLRKGRTVRITDVIHIRIPSDEIDIQMDHSFQAADYSLENQVSLLYNGVRYSIMTNFYDQSEEKFKYHMEIEMDFPGWKFSYVDTLLERNEGDIVGQSVATMPSGRIYTSSSRLKYENTLNYLNLELTYDTHARGDLEQLRISFRQALESTPSHLNFMISLETPDPMIGVEFSVEGLGTQPVYVFLKAFVSGTFEVELTSRSTRTQTEVGVLLDLIPYSKLIKSKVAIGRSLSGGGDLDGEVVVTSPQNPSFQPVTLTVSTSLEIKDPRIYIVKSDLFVMGWGWSAELRTELGRKPSDLQKFNVRVILPDKSSFEGESHLLLDFTDEEQNVGCKTEIRLPSGIIYKLSIGGSSSFNEASLAEANLLIDINSPFTKEMILKTQFRNHLSEDQRDFSFFCNTRSEAQYWNEFEIDFKWKQEKDVAKTVFTGKFGETEVNLDSLGFYKIQNGTHSVKVVIEVHLPTESGVQQLKVSTEGELLSTSDPTGVKVSQITYAQKNQVEVFRSSGNLEINIPETKGSLLITHVGGTFAHQEYKMQGTFDGENLQLFIQGMVETTPVRVAVYYTDGEMLKVLASYGGSSYASMGFMSRLEGFSFSLRESSASVSKMTTKGQITFRSRKTRFHHSLRVSPRHSSFNLQIDSLRGKPITVNFSRVKLSRDEWETDAKMEWGRMRVAYNDQIAFRGFKDFDVKASMNAPVYGLRDLLFHVISSHHDASDQTLSIKYMRKETVIHSGSFFIITSSLDSNNPYEINAELADIVINKKKYSDFKFRQYLALPQTGIEVQSLLTRGGTRLFEIGLNVPEDKRKMVFAVCSTDGRCLRFIGKTQSVNHNSPIKNFDVEVKILNSLLWKKADDDIIQHSIALSAENNYEKGEDVQLSAKISRSLCSDDVCEDSFVIGKHHVHLTASPKNMDVLYQTQNRTLLLKTSFNNGINETLKERDSKLLKIQLWFDRLNKPDNVLIWTTSYHVYDSDAKLEEVLESVLRHPYVERPVSVRGKLSTFANFKREALIDLDIFEEPENALQLRMLKDYREGGYNFEVHLKNIEEDQPHLSLSAILIPSPDAGFFDLWFNAPRLTSNGRSEDKNISFRYTCKMEVDRHITQMLCQMDSVSVSEEFGLSYGYAPDPCSGATASSNVFGNSYKAYGAYCNSPLNIATGVSLTEDVAEELRIKAGFVDCNAFEVDFLGVAKGDVTLFPPFLLQGSFQPLQTPHKKFTEFKEALVDEWKYLVQRSKSTAAIILEDFNHFSDVVETISKPSQIREMVNIFSHNLKSVLEELNEDQLFQDISCTIEASVNMSSELLEEGIAFMEDVTGSSLHMKDFSVYLSKVQEMTREMVSSLVSFLYKEMKWFEDYAVELAFKTSSSFQDLCNYAVNESVVSEPVKWVERKVKKLLSLDAWPPLLHIWTETLHRTRQILSFFYSGINEEITEKFAILLPLPQNFYDLESVFMLTFGKDSRKYSALSLNEEIKRWIHLLLHPQKLIEQTLPPYRAQGVVVRNSLITFDGRAHSMATRCPHLLVVIKGRNGTTPIALASRSSEQENQAPNREFLLLVGKDAVRVTAEKQIYINKSCVNLPYEKGPLAISRDLNQIEINLKDSWKRRVLSVRCALNHDSCFIDVSGWLFRDVQGLLGTFDSDPFDDYTTPHGNVSMDSNIWELSWRVEEENCSRSNMVLASLQTEPHSRFTAICSNLLLHKNSFMVPCHSTVNVHPYYAVCLQSLQELQFASQRIKRSANEGIDDSSSHNTTASLYPSPNKKISSDNRARKRAFNRAANGFDSTWKRSRQRLRMQSLHVNRQQKEVICDVAFAYSSVCFEHRVTLDLPLECDTYPLKPRNDKVDLKSISVDLVILFEEQKCISFIYNYILRDLFKNLREILSESSIGYNIEVGVVGYGSEKGVPLTFYGKGSSLLETIEEVESFLAEEPQTDQRRGTLEEAFVAATKFPFRRGTIRVIYVASCTDQDLPKISSAMTKEIRKRRIIVFSMTNAPLLHSRRTSDAFRSTIGIGSHHIYHLKRGEVQRKTTKFIIPPSNLVHLSLQSHGGVFSVASIKQEKRIPYFMKIFRQIFVKALLQSSEKVYATAKGRTRQNK